jgi:hypothetical protein
MNRRESPWETPQLIILVRSRPEEAVLSTCFGGGDVGPGAGKDACRGIDDSGVGVGTDPNVPPSDGNCGICKHLGAS